MKFFLSCFTSFCWLLVLNGGVVRAQTAADAALREIEIVNNQPFAVRMPVRLRGAKLRGGDWRIQSGGAIQADGDDAIWVADLPASGKLKINLARGKSRREAIKSLTVVPAENQVSFKFNNHDIGALAFDILYRDSRPEELKGEPYSTRADFSKDFEPLAIRFERVSENSVFDVWRGTAAENGLQLNVELRVFHDGFLDVNSEFKNVGATKIKDVYAAIVTRWQQPKPVARAVCYDNRISQLKPNDFTNFRIGDSRNWYVQRGVDWLRTDFANKTSVALMHDFSPSFTVYQEATQKRPGRFVGANIPQIGYEVQTSGDAVYELTEIARSNLRSYAERLEDNRLMETGESVRFASRFQFSKTTLSDEAVDDAFVAYTTYAEQKQQSGKIEMQLGAPFTRFGTNYFPYSTLGENFDIKKLPGMDRDAYWAFAADTVNKWQLFADDIRRDLRIAKTLGFELIRLHHLELIQGVEKPKQIEYLDFFFGEMRKLKLKALIDARISAAETAELVRRYRDVIDGVEVDNEVLIFGINDDAPAYWKRVYAAVKEVAPEIPVHLTAHTNTGAFDRLQKLNVPFDRIGQHAYTDGLDSLPNTRGFALAAGAYGRRAGKPPIITEWNWRFLTRMTPEARAKVYAPIFENVLKTRAMPVMYQFQFNETLAMNPKALKGIRHYEQIWLSRRPKPEAFVLSGLINKYGAPAHPNRLVEVEHAVVELDKTGRGAAQFTITNRTGRELNLKAAIEAPANLKADFENSRDNSLWFKPGTSAIVNIALQALPTDDSPAALPGFYHVFLRLEDAENDLLRYAWAEARLRGAPKMDAANSSENSNVVYAENVFAFDLNRPLAVVYGDKSPIQDVETASVLVNTLESATGRPVKMYELKDLPADERAALVLVGTAKTNQLIARVNSKIPANIANAKQFAALVAGDDANQDWLILSGANPLEAERAAMDWTIRFWKHAKDSAARRVGLVEKDLPLGFDPAQLP